jgi:MYXO-CTERM domain-containing protein
VDALRLTGSGFEPPEDDPGEPSDPDPVPPSNEAGGSGIPGGESGCALAAAPAPMGGWPAMLLAAALLARRRRG